MFARQRSKPRFHVDQPQPSSSAPHHTLPVQVIATPRRHKRRFRVGDIDAPERHLLPFQVVLAPRGRKRHLMLRSTQRRMLLRWGVYPALVVILLLAAVAGIYAVRQTRAQERAAAQTLARSLATEGNAPQLFRDRALQQTAVSPFPVLQSHLTSAAGQPPAVSAAAAYLFDPERGWVFYTKNADQPRSMASTTKIMTLLVATDYGSLDTPVTVGADAAALVNSQNSYMGVSAGEQLTLRELLYGLMVASGNDAAVAIADAIGGNEAYFVDMMNSHARHLGLTHTHYVSPDGLDDGNQTSARDLATLAAVAMENPDIVQITSTRHDTIPQTATHKAFEFWNTNDLLAGGFDPYPGTIGVKTGFTDAAGYCMVVAARVQGHLLVGVVLGDSSAQARNADAHALLDWGAAQETGS